jgi:hypothetical protein
MASGWPFVNGGNIPALAANLAGVSLANDVIDARQHAGRAVLSGARPGLAYRWLFAAMVQFGAKDSVRLSVQNHPTQSCATPTLWYQAPMARERPTPSRTANGSADPMLSATIAGIMFAHGLIDRRQCAAGEKFRQVRAEVFGMRLGNGDPRARMLERRYNALANKLSTDQLIAVVDLVLGIWQPWLRRQLLGVPLTTEDEVERQNLLDALDRLGGQRSVK